MDLKETNNESCEKYRCLKDASVYATKVIALLEHPITKCDIERQLVILNDYLKCCTCGYHLKDLQYAIRIFELISQKPEYETIFAQMLEISNLPIKMDKSSDILTYQRDLQEYFNLLGYLMVSLEDNYKIINIILKLINESEYKRGWVRTESCIEAAAQSNLFEMIGFVLEFGSEEVYPLLLKSLLVLVGNKLFSENLITKTDVFNNVLKRMERTWKARYPLQAPNHYSKENLINYEDTSKLLWMLLKDVAQNLDLVKDIQIPKQFALMNLKYALRFHTLNPINTIDRNNVVAILLRMLSLFPNMDFVSSGLGDDIITLILTATIGAPESYWTAEIAFSSKEEDFDLFKMLLMCLPYYVNFYSSLRILEDKMVIGALLKLLTGKQKTNWAEGYFKRLVKLTLLVFTKIVPKVHEDFMENNGPSILVNMFRIYRNDMNILKVCLQTMKHLSKRVKISITKSLVYNDGIELLLDICSTTLLNKSHLTRTDQNCLSFAFCILEEFCECAKYHLEKEIIELAFKFMRRTLKPKPNENYLHSRVIVCFLDFLWYNIKKIESVMEQFVKQSGIFLLLDIIQTCKYPVKLMGLGLLVDLCEFASCVPYLLTWRGRGLQTFKPMLLEIFREENKKIKTRIGVHGEILDPDNPLIGQQQRNALHCDCNDYSVSSISDLFASCRPKVYALLQFLDYNHAETVDIVNEAYVVGGNELKPIDQVTLLLAENFLALKQTETWTEVEHDLKISEIKLISIDSETLGYLLERKRKWGLCLQQVQREIIEKSYKMQKAKETCYYGEIIQTTLSSALEALRELKYIAKCSEKMFRITKKLIQTNQVERSREIKLTPRLSQTYEPRFNIHSTLNQTIEIESDVKVTQIRIDTLPVSPTWSVVLQFPADQDVLESPGPEEIGCFENA